MKSRLEVTPSKPMTVSKKIFSRIARKTLEKYQLHKVKKCIKHAYKNSPYYSRLFKENDLKPSDIKSLADLVKIPCTDPKDLQRSPESFFAVPEEKFVRIFTTAGSTGKPKKAYFTLKDLNKIITTAAVGAQLMYNISEKDVIRLTFETGYGTEIWGNNYSLSRAYELLGALVIATGRLKIEEELEIIREYKPTVFGDVSSRVNYLTKELSKICDLKELGIKKFFIGAEPTPKSMRRNIEDAWDADVYIGYGITEIGLLMAGECHEKNGMHLTETNFLMEVVDPETGEHLEDGETGELIFTTFDREGMPLIRYNSHDMGRIIPGICNCGLPLKRVEIKGRSDDLIPIGAGDNLFTKMFDEAMFSVPEVQEYQVIFERKDDRDMITIIAETSVRSDAVKKKIFDSIMKMPEINNGVLKSKTIHKPEIKLVKPSTFDRNSIKTKRLIDKRNLYE